mmetsp:Transcript_21516/g.45251  ORF Transcript_21516/g.45251 Transcript_21516/m.45251 type:complete len:155 (-) Transcript_21516:240-704(-)
MCPPTSTTMMKRRANKDSIIYDEPIITFTFQVPTKGCESPRQQGNHRRVDIDNLKTKDDLDNLKKNDPFLFYSIPAAKEAILAGENLDISTLKTSSIRRNFYSCPARMETAVDSKEPSSTRSVSRKSRISFECHDSFLMMPFDLGDEMDTSGRQ